MHLSPEEFIDVAEGTRPEASLPHLAACEQCRGELAGVRRTMSAAVDAEVPEPPAPFWRNLSACIGERIDADVDGSWWRAWIRPRLLVPVSAVAVLALVVALASTSRSASPASGNRMASAAVADGRGAADPANDTPDLAADPLLTLVSDLSANLDVDAASAAFAERDSAEHAVTHMSADELTALKQILQAEMTRSGV